MTARDDEMTALGRLLGDDWAAKMAAERTDERSRMVALRARLLAAAKTAGAATITAHYEGGSDSGVVDNIYAEPKEADARLADISVDCPQPVYNAETRAYRTELLPIGFLSAAADFFAWIVTEQNGNWWDGDIETSGDVVWHVADDPDRITGEHNHIVRQSEYTEWEEDREDDIADGPTPTAET